MDKWQHSCHKLMILIEVFVVDNFSQTYYKEIYNCALIYGVLKTWPSCSCGE